MKERERDRLRMRIPATVSVVVTLALLLVPSASARTIRLNWVEQRSKTFFPNTPMTFKVKHVVLSAKGWSVRASFTNRSKGIMRLRRGPASYYAQYDFGLGWAAAQDVGTPQLETLRYTSAKPAFPKRLRAGQTWSGVFSGRGSPPKRYLVYVTFGVFDPVGALSREKHFSWVTQHSFKL